ncbi:MAG TPA: hypothetical protein VN457_04395, partial [Chlamydiales bacterium]|nr:hypothetical protein [Chlamydiales bacterium]
GPRIEATVQCSRGKRWLISVLALEQERREERAVVLFQSLIFSLERVLAYLVERDKGNLPRWANKTL